MKQILANLMIDLSPINYKTGSPGKLSPMMSTDSRRNEKNDDGER